jgi:hypothetical protein
VIASAAGAPKINWTARHIRNGLDEIQNLCIQFRRIESFSRFSQGSSSTPIALITKDEAEQHVEYEIHLSKTIVIDAEVNNTVVQLQKLLGNVSIERRRAALSKLLIENMDKIQMENDAS